MCGHALKLIFAVLQHMRIALRARVEVRLADRFQRALECDFGQQRLRSPQTVSGVQQQIVMPIVLLPDQRFSPNALDGSQVDNPGPEPVVEQVPLAQQGFVGDLDDFDGLIRFAHSTAVCHQKALLHEARYQSVGPGRFAADGAAQRDPALGLAGVWVHSGQVRKDSLQQPCLIVLGVGNGWRVSRQCQRPCDGIADHTAHAADRAVLVERKVHGHRVVGLDVEQLERQPEQRQGVGALRVGNQHFGQCWVDAHGPHRFAVAARRTLDHRLEFRGRHGRQTHQHGRDGAQRRV